MAVNNYQITPRRAAENKVKRATISTWIIIAITVLNAVISCIDKAGNFSGLSLFVSSYAFIIRESLLLPIIVPIIVTVIPLAVLALCAVLGVKKPVFNIVTAVIFGLDTLFMAYCFISKLVVSESTYSVLIGFFFHAWILYDIIIGILAAKKLKNMPEEEVKQQTPFREDYNYVQSNTDENKAEKAEADVQPKPEKAPSETALYAADKDGEIRLEGEYSGVKIAVKRKFGLTELVLNGQVYDKYDRIIEEAYVLSAKADGITVAYTQSANGDAELNVNGETVGNIKINV